MPQVPTFLSLSHRMMLAGLAMLTVCGLAGCGGTDEDSAKNQADQFEVADGDPTDASSDPASVNISDIPGGARETGSDDQPSTTMSEREDLAAANGGDPGNSPGGQPPAAPQFDPLAIPDANQLPDDETQLLAMLETMRNQQPEGRTQQEMLENYVRLQYTRVKAAEKLWSLAEKQESRISAVQSKLDAMRTLVLAGAPGVADQMQAYCENLQANEDSEIGFYGRLTLFGMKIDALAGGEPVDTPKLLEELKSLAADAKDNPGAFGVINQAAQVLQRSGQREAALDAYKAISAAFADSEDPQLIAAAAAMTERVRVMEAGLDQQMQALLTGETDDEAPVLATILKLLDAEGAGAGTMAEVAQVAQYLEVTQHYDMVAQVYQKIADAFRDNPDAEFAQQAVAMAEAGLKRVSLIGKPLVVTGVDLDGTPIDWTAYKGKVVLIDFWATWCGPCLAEMPNIAHAYSQHKDRGFEVIGISLDDDKQSVLEFIDVQPLPWTVLVSADPAKQGFENPMAVQCGVESIPFIVLIGRDGNVAALHTRGPQLQEKVKELLGPVDPAAIPEQPSAETPGSDAPAETPATPVVPATDAPAQPAAGEQSGALPRDPEFYFVAIEETGQAADQDATEAKEDEVNIYAAAEDLSTKDLVEFIFDMQDKPRSIQARPGFGQAVIEAADRILAAEPSDKFLRIAAETKFEILHDRASMDDEEADAALIAFAEQLKDCEDPRILKLVQFLRMERRAIEVDELPLDDVPKLLAELKKYLADEALEEHHLRLASNIVRAINRLAEDQREEYFQDFGSLFAKSKSKQLARYGKKLTKKPAAKMTDLVDKPMELAGVTEMGAAFDWASYRGKVVVVDFWATWCGPCRAAMPQVKALYEELHNQGFEVVGVSLDDDAEKAAKYLEENAIPWTNLVGEETKEIAEKYGVRGIPTMIVVDQEGNIVSADHKLETLKAQIEKLLKPSA